MSGQLQVRNSAGERTMAKCSQLEEQQAALRYVQRMQGEQLNLMQSWLGDLIDQYNTRPQQQSFPAPDLPLRLCDKLDSLGSGDRSSLATSQGDMQLQLHTSSAVQPRVQSPSTSGGGALGTSRSLLLTNRTTPGTARAPDAHPLDFSDGMSSASDSSPQRTAEPSPSRRHSQAVRSKRPHEGPSSLLVEFVAFLKHELSSFCIGENGSIPMETSASPAAGGAIPATKQSIVKNASRNTSTPPTAPRTRVVDPRQSPPPIASGIAKRGTRPRSTPLGAGGVNSNPAASRLSATHFNGSITRSTDQGGPRAATRSKLGSPTRSCGSVLSSSKAGSQSMQQLSKPHGPAAGTAEPPSPSHSVQSGMTSPGSANRSRQMGFPTPARRSMQGSQVGSQAAKPVKRAFGSSLSRGLGAEPSGADRNGPSPMNSSRSNIRLKVRVEIMFAN
ncbi:hypothetical protein WJX84_009353 [Apatococcus fuscideae]|uniref:Uncharacterized protein n=1 Tax=Apatococcus fuscideae TaxID=2026836 RepID=A0AAW1SBL7_9CHLO